MRGAANKTDLHLCLVFATHPYFFYGLVVRRAVIPPSGYPHNRNSVLLIDHFRLWTLLLGSRPVQDWQGCDRLHSTALHLPVIIDNLPFDAAEELFSYKTKEEGIKADLYHWLKSLGM